MNQAPGRPPAEARKSAAPVGGDYSLVDHNGRRVRPRDFAGRHVLYFFGFTHCRMVCPEMLEKLSAAISAARLSEADLQPLYVTVDPERDTPERMKSFLERFPRFLGLTGSPNEVEEIKRLFKVFAVRQEDPGEADGYRVPHSAYSFLMDPEGRCVAYFAAGASAAEVAERLRSLIMQSSSSD
jgi:protein SCO1/2